MASGSLKLKRSVDLTIQEGELPVFLLVPGFDLDWPSLGHGLTPNLSKHHRGVTPISLAWPPASPLEVNVRVSLTCLDPRLRIEWVGVFQEALET